MTDVLKRRGEDTQKDTKGRRPGDYGGRDQRGAATSYRTPKIAGSHKKLGEEYGTDSPSVPLEGTNLTHTFILDFGPSEL